MKRRDITKAIEISCLFDLLKSQHLKETVSGLQIQYSSPLILKKHKNMKKYG